MRLRGRSQAERLETLKAQWLSVEHRAVGHFVVVTHRKIRVRPVGGGVSR